MENKTIRRAEIIRKLKVGSVARLITIAVVAVIILLNVIATYILSAHPIKLDMTGTGFYSLEKKTEEFLPTVNSGVKITLLADKEVFASTGRYYNQVVECMELYAKGNPLIKVSYVDLVENPAFTTKYPDKNLDSGMILVESEKTGRSIALDANDYFNTELNSSTYSYQITSVKTEEALTGAIINTTNESPKTIGVLSGHGEGDVSGFTNLLYKNGYTVDENVTLYSGKLEKDYDALIICSPTNDYSDNELNILEDYMENGKKLGKTIFYFAAAEQKNTPNLYAYLAEWGISYYEGTVYETDTDRRLSDEYFSILSYADNTFTEGLENSSVPLVSLNSKPIKLLYETEGDYRTQTLAGFTSTARLLPAGEDQKKFDPDKAEKGPFGGIVVSKKSYYEYTEEGQYEESSSHVYAFASNTLQDETIIGADIFANGQYLLSLCDERFNRTASVSLIPKVVAARNMNITQGQATVFLVVFAVVIPLCVIVAGVVVWLRRRHS